MLIPIRPSGNQPQGLAVSVRLPWGAWDYMAAPALAGGDGSGTLEKAAFSVADASYVARPCNAAPACSRLA